MNDERRKEYLERKKKLYEVNKKLLEIDPNLIIQIKLKFLDYSTIVTTLCGTSYLVFFKKISKPKRFFFIFTFWFLVQYSMASYYFNIYPFILLKNTKELMEKEGNINKLNSSINKI